MCSTFYFEQNPKIICLYFVITFVYFRTPSVMSVRSCMDGDASRYPHRTISDKHVIPVVTVFDDLKGTLYDLFNRLK